MPTYRQVCTSRVSVGIIFAKSLIYTVDKVFRNVTVIFELIVEMVRSIDQFFIDLFYLSCSRVTLRLLGSRLTNAKKKSILKDELYLTML